MARCSSPTSAPRSSRSRTRRRGGDAGRHVGPHLLGEDDSQYFQTWGSNKKSVTLDLKTEDGREAFRRLAASAEAVVNNLRGDQPEKLGLDYAVAEGRQPGDRLPAYLGLRPRQRAQKLAGLRFPDAGGRRAHEPDRRARRPAEPLRRVMIDFMTGMTGIVGLLGCVMRARATGQGCDVDTCLFDVALHQLSYPARLVSQRRRHADAAAAQLAPVADAGADMRTEDGWMYVMCMMDKFWEELARRIGRAELTRMRGSPRRPRGWRTGRR